MDQLEKLRVLLPHWIEHNQGHTQECRKWTDQIDELEVCSNLEKALVAMEEVTRHLQTALTAAGGPKDDGDGHHHHH